MKNISFVIVLVTLVFYGTGCSVLPLLGPTPTATPTETPLPSPTPPPTNTPEPTTTFTQPPPTDTLPPPPTGPPPAPAQPTATLSVDQAVLVYYINKNEKGPFGCGEALWYIKTHFPKTGNIPVDVTNALKTILTYHSDTIGILYHPGYASNLAVKNVELNGGEIKVYLSGEYVKTKDPCDAARFKDQLRYTIKQFPGITTIIIYINGFPIGDVMSRK
ncbi:MAG: GerMN domain-containing protein [Anaerolineales bacterium]|nr:GerMN domain-containing protein [Anaerolineales bacterium]